MRGAYVHDRVTPMLIIGWRLTACLEVNSDANVEFNPDVFTHDSVFLSFKAVPFFLIHLGCFKNGDTLAFYR
jgi:hypothetical protein